MEWAQQYFYRERFGLSWAEYMAEPITVFKVNQFIAAQINLIREGERRRLERNRPRK